MTTRSVLGGAALVLAGIVLAPWLAIAIRCSQTSPRR